MFVLVLEASAIPVISLGESHFLTPSLSWRKDYQMWLALLLQKSDPGDHRGVLVGPCSATYIKLASFVRAG